MQAHPDTMRKGTRVKYYGNSKNIPDGSVGTVIRHRRDWSSGNVYLKWDDEKIPVSYVSDFYLSPLK